jgi:hypothetical protein
MVALSPNQGFLLSVGDYTLLNVIIRLCAEHAETASSVSISEVRKMWTWSDCGCFLIVDDD